MTASRSMPSASPRALPAAIASFLRDRRAVALVETAIVVPALIVMGFTGVELANLVTVHTRMSDIALTLADNAARINSNTAISNPPVRESDINEVFAAVTQQGVGLAMPARSRLILSSLERNAEGGQWVHWQRCWGNRKDEPLYGKAGDGATGVGYPGMGPTGAVVKAPADGAVMFVELVHNYQPIIYPAWTGKGLLIRYKAAFTVRDRRDLGVGVINPTGATPSTCA